MKLKKEYLEYSIFVKGKRLYFAEMNEKQMKHWSENGFKGFFEATKPVKADKIEDKKEINEENDTNK